MTPAELVRRANAELAELGPRPPGGAEAALWDEERRGAAVLLAALADWDGAIVRRALFSVDLADDLRDLLVRALGECGAPD